MPYTEELKQKIEAYIEENRQDPGVRHRSAQNPAKHTVPVSVT